ncbi:single-stranded-DNA-specific exonuclease RecJ [Kiritimatiellota bacterium B12222]|nr:single-stranded-DNA-specific exonuclease RecJ [Kiritimatiellota bacterium B12222]
MHSLSRIWLEADSYPEESVTLSERYGLPLPIARLLAQRGLTEEADIASFLEPRLERLSDPMLLPDMEKAVFRIWQAIQSDQKILIFGDYDVDGVTSTAFLSRVLEKLGAKVSRFIPNRKDDGYGLSPESILHCLETYDPQLIITVDCGTGSKDAVQIAKEKGVDVVVTDHHEASGEIADAYALVNPKLGDEEGLRMLAGVGVAFKLCHAMIKYGRKHDYPVSKQIDMRPLMYLVALGTVADMVPLIGENRILARYGIDILNTLPDPGIEALAKNAGIQQEMSSYHIGFVLGPRINAAGRIDSPDIALEMLLSSSSRHADRQAKILEKANKERQSIEEAIRLEAVKMLESSYDASVPGVMVVASRGWHAGVVGIVASRLVRLFHRPAIVISIADDGIGRGSCRSIEGFDLIQHLQVADDLLMQYGGHRMAAGLDIREEDIDEFRKRINQRAVEVMADTDLRPRQHIDAWIEREDLTEEFLEAQNRLMPFGHDNPVPVWGLKNVYIQKHQKVGRDKQHLRLIFETTRGRKQDAIGFGLGNRKLPDGPMDLAFQLRKNVFRGEARLQLMLQDIRPSE